MPKKFSIPQKVSAPRCIKSYILMETISAFFLRTSIIDIQTERRLFPIFHCSFHKSFISIASSFILSRPQNKQDHTFCLDKGDLVIKTLQEDKKSCTVNFLRQGISRHSSWQQTLNTFAKKCVDDQGCAGYRGKVLTISHVLSTNLFWKNYHSGKALALAYDEELTRYEVEGTQ